jgi:hypothetical protein
VTVDELRRKGHPDVDAGMVFEGNPPRFSLGTDTMEGIQDFTRKSTHDEHRKLITNFWQD